MPWQPIIRELPELLVCPSPTVSSVMKESDLRSSLHLVSLAGSSSLQADHSMVETCRKQQYVAICHVASDTEASLKATVP